MKAEAIYLWSLWLKRNIYFDVSYLMGFIADPIKYETSVPSEKNADIDTAQCQMIL